MIRYLNPYNYTRTSRYAKLRTIKRDGVEKSYHEVVNATPKVDVSSCQLFKVTGLFINRLDLIADKFYGDASLWWYIAKQNDITEFEVVPADTVLQIPPYDSLMTEGRVLEPLSYVYLNLGEE
jgi:hypothetical protein